MRDRFMFAELANQSGEKLKAADSVPIIGNDTNLPTKCGSPADKYEKARREFSSCPEFKGPLTRGSSKDIDGIHSYAELDKSSGLDSKMENDIQNLTLRYWN